MFKLSRRSNRHLKDVHPDLVKVVRRALEITKIDFGIPFTGGYRTTEQQNALFKSGKSQLDGYNRSSRHQFGEAVDVFAYVDGAASWDEDHLTHVATAMLAAASELGVKIRWGGHWRSFVDMPHFEVIK